MCTLELHDEQGYQKYRRAVNLEGWCTPIGQHSSMCARTKKYTHSLQAWFDRLILTGACLVFFLSNFVQNCPNFQNIERQMRRRSIALVKAKTRPNAPDTVRCVCYAFAACFNKDKYRQGLLDSSRGVKELLFGQLAFLFLATVAVFGLEWQQMGRVVGCP